MNIANGVRIAVDVGGTFTDCVVVDSSGERLTTKSSTTPSDPVKGVVESLRIAAELQGATLPALLSATTGFVHGTTMATNLLVERRGARTGLLMTRGHEHTLIIGRVSQKVAGLSEREKTHSSQLSKADPPIVFPEDTRAVTERVDQRGQVVVPLDVDEAAKTIDELAAGGIEAVAICLLWSFVNPRHEERLRELVEKRHRGLFVSVSSDVAPVLGEYERCVATAINACLGPRIGAYFARVKSALREGGMKCPLLVMQADGGVGPVEAIRNRPILTLDSGPAGGVLGSQMHAKLLGEKNLICADVGGTTFDVGLVFDEQAEMDPSPIIDKYVYQMPKVFVKSIGAGGGSIAWRDRMGNLRVGPQSAGAAPGPACYGRGGKHATLTDALLVLGYFDPKQLIGGAVSLDFAAAEAAVRLLADELSMPLHQLAAGIATILTAQTADLLRKVTTERGLDPRQFALIAYGGAGPMLAPFMAAQAGVRTVYVPPDSGVFSALGMLTTDITFRSMRSHKAKLPIDEHGLATINRIYQALDADVAQQFSDRGYDTAQVQVTRSAKMRFRMQVHELPVEVPLGALGAETVATLMQAFQRKYESVYGPNSAHTGAGVELVQLGAVGRFATERPRLMTRSDMVRREAVPTATREVHFLGGTGALRTPIYRAEDISSGRDFAGPSIIERMGDTVVIPPGWRAKVDNFGIMRLDQEGGR